jgi:hypothetical protein
MRFRGLAVAILFLAQVIGAFVAVNASAQGNQQVIILIGDKGRHVCEVVYSRSNHRDGRDAIDESGPEACQGGHVYAYQTTQAQVPEQKELARARALSAGSSSALVVRVVPLTGDGSADIVAVQDEITAIHELFAPEEDSDDLALSSDFVLGYMAPGALQDEQLMRPAPSTAVLAADCKRGRVGQFKQAKAYIEAFHSYAKVRTRVFYERITCNAWKIYRVETQLVSPSDHRLWFNSFEYQRVNQIPGLGFSRGYWDAGCGEVKTGSPTSTNPNWKIRAGALANVELIDDEFGDGGRCTGFGNSYSSDGFTLKGGKS